MEAHTGKPPPYPPSGALQHATAIGQSQRISPACWIHAQTSSFLICICHCSDNISGAAACARCSDAFPAHVYFTAQKFSCRPVSCSSSTSCILHSFTLAQVKMEAIASCNINKQHNSHLHLQILFYSEYNRAAELHSAALQHHLAC